MAFLRRSGHYLVADTPTASPASGYLVAVAAVIVALLARLPFAPLFGVRFPFITLFPAVFFAAWYGGFRPALLATLLGVLAVWFALTPPVYAITVPSLLDGVGMALFAAI